MENSISKLNHLKKRILDACSWHEKIAILDDECHIQDFLEKTFPRAFLNDLSPESEYVIKAVVAIGQGNRIFTHLTDQVLLEKLLKQLLIIERYYEDLGGIIGYQCIVLHLIKGVSVDAVPEAFEPPKIIDIRTATGEVKSAIDEGIKGLSEMGEIYPLGGAGDRLRLVDEETGELLPASKLKFLGKTLLEGLISDLQAREYLYYKRFGKQLITPIAIMTSHEKNNHKHVIEICEKRKWFGRPKDSFKFFCQPSVPTFTEEGHWCLEKPMQLLLKPGGHGAVWKLALSEGVFDWFIEKKRKKLLIRQINNPLASVDYGILAFMGWGHLKDKDFGFASCPRRIKAAEGVNVIKKWKDRSCLSNIEYCDFKKYGIQDMPLLEEAFSLFPSNTNILFAKIQILKMLAKKNPYPGVLINFRPQFHFDPLKGSIASPTARIETTMQNIADGIDEEKAYLTFNHRHKTIAAIKREENAESILETPEGTFHDYLRNSRELLVQHCGFQLDDAIFTYHPALGPLYDVISQKIKKGQFAQKAHFHLGIAEAMIENLYLDGSLRIQADEPLGHTDEKELLYFSMKAPRCLLKNVKVINAGVNKEAQNIPWRGELNYRESCLIKLSENSEFIAEDIALRGDICIEVPKNCKIIAKEINGKLAFIEV